MNLDGFYQVADRVHAALLLVSAHGKVVASNRAARTALGPDIEGCELAARTRDPAQLRRYLKLAARSTSPSPGAFALSGAAGTRWRCDASLATPAGLSEAALLLIHVRPSSEGSVRFLALNQQIERLSAEIRRREALEAERSRLLDAERQARAQAEQAARLKDEFLASISHELRTPLHAISGWVGLLQEKPADADLTLRGLEVIDRNVRAQTQLVEDLIDLSQVTTGRMRLNLQPVNLDEVVRQAVQSAQPAAAAKRQRVELVSEVGGCIINGDPERLLQVFWNLLSNATKYTPKDGKIQVVVRRINSHVEVLVSDTGPGISGEFLPFVFDRFRRGDGSRSRRSGGLGLGLSIVRHLVELHGGVVMADSEGPGTGTTFTVNLPLPLFRGRSAVSDGARLIDPPSRRKLEGLHILLVEDHDDSRELLASILESRGASVSASESSNAAQEAFRARRPDVIISDIEMPGEDGFTLIRKLRVLEREEGAQRTPAIAVTAHTIGDARVHALRSGYQAFLSKPVSSLELVELVTSLCDPSAVGRAGPSSD